MKGVLTWDSLRLCEVKKLAEGSYAQVYELWDRSIDIRSIFKVMAIKPPSGIGGRRKTSVRVEDVVSELMIMEDMTEHRGFVEFREASILAGRLSPAFMDAWAMYNQRNETIFPNPHRYNQDQLYLTLELGHAGTSLESYEVTTTAQCWDIILGVIVALAKGEDVAEFEVSFRF